MRKRKDNKEEKIKQTKQHNTTHTHRGRKGSFAYIWILELNKLRQTQPVRKQRI